MTAQASAEEQDATHPPWGAIIKVQLDKRVVSMAETSILKVTVTKDPLVMITYLPPIPLTDEAFAKAREDLDALASGGCSALTAPYLRCTLRSLHRGSRG